MRDSIFGMEITKRLREWRTKETYCEIPRVLTNIGQISVRLRPRHNTLGFARYHSL